MRHLIAQNKFNIQTSEMLKLYKYKNFRIYIYSEKLFEIFSFNVS